MKYKNEWTCIGCGLRTAQKVFAKSTRVASHKVAIVVTDGENNKPDNKDDDLVDAASNLKSFICY